MVDDVPFNNDELNAANHMIWNGRKLLPFCDLFTLLCWLVGLVWFGLLVGLVWFVGWFGLLVGLVCWLVCCCNVLLFLFLLLLLASFHLQVVIAFGHYSLRGVQVFPNLTGNGRFSS